MDTCTDMVMITYAQVDWCGNSPQWMGAQDYRAGLRKDAFFARKFHHPAAFDAADAHLGQPLLSSHLLSHICFSPVLSRQGERALSLLARRGS